MVEIGPYTHTYPVKNRNDNQYSTLAEYLMNFGKSTYILVFLQTSHEITMKIHFNTDEICKDNTPICEIPKTMPTIGETIR